MKIVAVRGACGSGKSTTVRTIQRERQMRPTWYPGRVKPSGYTDVNLFVTGHYLSDTMGGIDSFVRLEDAYDVIRGWSRSCVRDVLYEGKIQEERAADLLHMSWDLGIIPTVLQLTTSMRECIESVRQRTTACDIGEDVIRRTHAKAEREALDLERAGAEVHFVTRYNAVTLLRRILR